jgi:hypothetical protein
MTATRQARKPKTEPNDAQKRWNKGKVGKPTAPRHTPVARECPKPQCGHTAPPGERCPTGMVRVEVDGSRDPARWYCRGRCATYGEALADIRAIPDSLPTTDADSNVA